MAIKKIITEQIRTNLQNRVYQAVNSETYSKFGSDELEGYRVQLIIADENSPYYLESISVKIKNLNPSIPTDVLSNIRGKKVKLKNLKVGIFNADFTFSAEDVHLAEHKQEK